MAVRRNIPNVGYGLTDALQNLAPQPIVSNRAPSANDVAEIGTNWVDQSTNAVYCITSVVSGLATWTTSPASGVGTFTSVTITGGVGTVLDVQAGDVSIGAGNLAVVGNTTLTGDITVSGVTTLNGDIDINTASLFDITSTANLAPSISFTVNGGTTETMLLSAVQGTAANSIDIQSTVGGVLISSGRNNAQAIRLNATAGGIDILASNAAAGEDIDIVATGSSVNITSTENAADSVVITSTLGGIDILASGAAAGEDIDIVATGSSVNITSTENVADSIVISSTNGGIDITAAGAAAGEDIDITATGSSININATENDANAIVIRTNGGTAEKVNVIVAQGTGVDSVNISSTAGGITLTSNLATADGINLNAIAGGVDIDGALQVNIASAQAAAANSVRIIASAADGGIDVDAGTGGITIDSTGAFSIDGAAASNVTTTGAGIDLTLSSVLGSVIVSATEVAADAIQLTTAATGGITVNASSAAMIVHRAVNVDAPAATNALTSTSLTTGKAAVFTSSAATVDALDCVVGGIQVDPVSSAAGASPRTVSARHGQAIFTDVIANGAYGTLTVTNTLCAAASIIIGNASCTTVNSAIQIVEITPGVGSFAVRIFNAGAASTAANILVNFWLMNS